MKSGVMISTVCNFPKRYLYINHHFFSMHVVVFDFLFSTCIHIREQSIFTYQNYKRTELFFSKIRMRKLRKMESRKKCTFTKYFILNTMKLLFAVRNYLPFLVHGCRRSEINLIALVYRKSVVIICWTTFL